MLSHAAIRARRADGAGQSWTLCAQRTSLVRSGGGRGQRRGSAVFHQSRAGLVAGRGPCAPVTGPGCRRSVRLVAPAAAAPGRCRRAAASTRAWRCCTWGSARAARRGTAASGRARPAAAGDALRGQRRRLNAAQDLGRLLAVELGLELRRVGSGRHRTFAAGEPVLSAWMEQNTRVSWLMHDRPQELEDILVAGLGPAAEPGRQQPKPVPPGVDRRPRPLHRTRGRPPALLDLASADDRQALHEQAVPDPPYLHRD